MNNFKDTILDNLSAEERRAVIQILQEYKDTGSSDTFTEFLNSDFKEQPVDILTFIKDDRFLGKAWHLPNGKFKLFPYWEKVLKRLFPTPYETSVNNAIFSGARGLGKSEIAVTCLLYMMYRLMCLKDPYLYLNLKPTEKVAFAFMNITEALAYDIGVNKFQHTVQASPWFMQRGTITGRAELVWNPPEFINIIIGSQPRHVIGQAIYAAFMDEISFIQNQDIDKQKQKALDIIDTALGGMRTRFLNKGKNPTLLILASSKRSEKSFLETHMKKKLQTEGENTLIVDEPVWNIRPQSEYSGNKFKVALGNKFLASEIIPEGQNELNWKDKGYKILYVPVEYRAAFLEDIDRALCDYAGVSSSELTKYISASRLSVVRDENFVNPFTKDIIEVGNASTDNTQYYDFFDLEKIPPELKSKPLFIHLDMSISGDNTGIGGVFILGKKPGINQENYSKELYFKLAFIVSIKAPKGYQVSFAKNREFIYWLKKNGFNIKGISSDTFQNVSIGQELQSKGFNYSVVSVDKVNSSKICEPYAYLKNCIYEERIRFPYNASLLAEELLGLERNGNTGRIDHPDGGRSGSKDAADAICGALWNASQHGDEFNFEYGEMLDSLIESNTTSMDKEQKQIVVDFEEMMKQIFDNTSNERKIINNQDQKKFLDFGMGRATDDYSSLYLSQGIII